MRVHTATAPPSFLVWFPTTDRGIGWVWEREQRSKRGREMEQAERELDALILEYFTSRGLLQTHATFQTERQHKTKQATPTKTSGVHSEFLVAFECGERSVFFELWDRHVSKELRGGDPTCQSLEFSASVYFAVYPSRMGTGSSEQAMREFKGYLETRGAVLAHSTEFATYCALPYIPDPSQHPSFKTLFTDSWSAELKARLIQFLKLTLPESSDTPHLLSLYLDLLSLAASYLYCNRLSCDGGLKIKLPSSKQGLQGGGGGSMVQSLQKQMDDCERQYMKKLTEVQSSYHTLVGIAMELIGALESAVAGRMVTVEYIQDMCSRLFGESMQRPPDLQRPTTSTSILRASVMSLRQSVHVGGESNLPPLNFSKVKADLCTGSNSRKCCIIQALRWRLTRSLPGPQRNAALSSLVDHDILGCATKDTYQTSILSLLSGDSAPLREQLCRFFNTLSSLTLGRSYLARCPQAIRTLCGVMMREEGDTPARRNALGAVQKLSLRRPLQTLMIGAGLQRWVVELLRDQDSLSEYTLRYALALLMNLCLRTAGKHSCVAFGAAALKALSELLEHDDQEICSYVNGILYSLLTLPELREEAQALGMGDMLSSALRANPSELQSQIKYIIAQLNSDVQPLSGEESGEEEEEEEDDEEDPDVIEGDEEEVVMETTELTGEELLTRDYLSTATAAVISGGQPDVREVMQLQARKVMEAPYARPVTPQNFNQRPHTSTAQVSTASPQFSSKASRRPVSSAS